MERGEGKLQVIKTWCARNYYEEGSSSSSANPKQEVIPEELWKCLRLDLADEDFLSQLLEDSSLCLSKSQLTQLGKAAVALASRYDSNLLYRSSRSTYSVCCTIPNLYNDDVQWNLRMRYEDPSRYSPASSTLACICVTIRDEKFVLSAPCFAVHDNVIS